EGAEDTAALDELLRPAADTDT
ncbi:MAG: hypothetical protein QOI83_2583, partial [Streptomycetaceae bacterium]|nr:hypothetical protein [Streptomycetaceae bacterium]